MSGEKFLEEALEKSDADLFKELFRLYPLAHVEDYYKAGWQNDLMKTDIQLFWAHREESGAPLPPPIEELELPTFPSVTDPKTTTPETTTPTTTATTTTETTPKAKVKEVRTIIVSPVLPQDETLEILVFVNKHGLDLTKTKVLLAPVERSRRGTLMADFSPGMAIFWKNGDGLCKRIYFNCWWRDMGFVMFERFCPRNSLFTYLILFIIWFKIFKTRRFCVTLVRWR